MYGERKEQFDMNKKKRLAGDNNCRDKNQQTRINALDSAWGNDKFPYKGEGAAHLLDLPSTSK